MPDAVTHPTTQELAAFGLGKMPERRAAAVAAHLESCPACRKAVANVPPDSFLGKVRNAKPSLSSLPSRSNDAPRIEKAAEPSAPPKDLPPDLANYSKYRFLRELGRGGMGVVYQADQTVMGRTVAVKVINPSVLDHPDALPRFQSEVRAAAKLDHPNIVRAHDAEQVGSMHLLVMEYVEGTSLAELVAKKGPLSVAYACHFIRQAALGLQHAFEQGMVHRDIKPHNLMVNARGQVKVLDFGLARMRSERKAGGGLTQVDAFMGTPEYVSPEQATDARSADTRADIYSLGCTLFFLLAGRPPFQGDAAVKVIMAHIEKEAPALQEVRPEVPAELSAVVSRMLTKDPACRFQTPVEVAQALAAFVKPGTKQASGVSSASAGVSSPGTGTMLAADTSKIKAILGDVPRKVPTSDVPAKEEAASVFAGIGEPVASAKKKEKAARKAAKPAASAQPSSQKRWLIGGGLGVGVLLLVLVGMWASGVFMVKTKYGTIVLENLPAGAEVLVDGENVTLRIAEGKTLTISARTKHQLQVMKPGFTILVKEEVEIDAGERRPIQVSLKPEIPRDSPETVHHRPGWVDEEWLRKVAALPAEQQVEAVKAMLPERNPGYKGSIKARIENGVVTEIQLDGAAVQDLSPLLVFAQLRKLDCSCADSWQSPLADLSPLTRLPIRSLRYPYHTWLGAEQFRSIKTLETINDQLAAAFWKKVDGEASGFKSFCQMVAALNPDAQVNAVANRIKERNPGFDGNLRPVIDKSAVVELGFPTDAVVDISPLRALPELQRLHLETWSFKGKLADLTPLQGLPLTYLNLLGCNQVGNLKPLQGMKLTYLELRSCGQVRDLTPLKGMPLTELNLWVCDRLRDLTPLQGMKLTHLYLSECHQVQDLTPLRGMPLTILSLANCWSVRDLTPLQGMKLTYLSLWGCGQVVKDLTPLRGMPLTELDLLGCGQVQDLAPLQGMKLTRLNLAFCGQVRNLSPLQGMPLTWLDLIDCGQVHDLTPLQGMPLESINFTPKNITKGIEILRSIKTLEKINGKPAAQFWKEVDGTNTSKELLPPKPEGQGFVPLFNGKDLRGWKVFGGGRGNWKVEDGVLVGSGAMSHLFSERGDYENFQYRVEAMINDGGNSGQYFRTEYGPRFPKGYEAQINSTHGDFIRTGSLYPSFGKLSNTERDKIIVRDQLVKPNEWFWQEVVADGNHIIIMVQGKTTVDFVDDKNTYRKGHFALQQHNPGTVVKFRKIEVKELPATKSEIQRPTNGAVSGSPGRQTESGLPPEAKEAAEEFKKAREEARAKLLTEFDTVLDRLAKKEGAVAQRLKMIDVVKEEKKRFEDRGLIPFSERMRPYLAKYLVTNKAAEDNLSRVYTSLIDAQLRAKNESMKADLKADLESLLNVRVVARWRHFWNGKNDHVVTLYSNRRLNNSNGDATWRYYTNGVLFYRLPDAKLPGGFWTETLQVSADGMRYEGSAHNNPALQSVKMTAVYLKDD